MPRGKFIALVTYIILLFAIPFFLMIYALRCERLRLSSQKRLIDRLVEEQRQKRHEEETKYVNCIDICDDEIPERY